MTDPHAVRDDIRFLRALAEDGRDAPLTIGPALFFAGMIFGPAAALAVWGGVTGRITADWADPALFLGAGLVYAGLMWRTRRAREAGSGVGSRANHAASTAWMGVAFTIPATVLALVAVGAATHDGRMLLALPPLVLAAYGAAWTVAAAASRQRWLWAVALGSFGAAVGLGALAGSGVVFFGLFVVSVFLLLALPGLILMLQARRAA